MRRPLMVLVLFLAALPLLATPSNARPAPTKKVAGAVAPTWAQTEAEVRKVWAERYPREVLVAVDRVGEATFSEEAGGSTTTGATTGSFDWGSFSWNETSWSTTIKNREGSFLRQKVDVTVERPNKSRARFHVAVLYKLVGGQWQSVEMPVGQVEELAAAGAPAAPSDEAMAAAFTAAWSSGHPGFSVQSVTVTGKEFKQSKGKFWFTCRLRLELMGTDKAPEKYRGQHLVCTPQDYASILNWNKTTSTWVPDERMVRDVNLDRVCELTE